MNLSQPASRRWTSARIRKATALPKPTGAQAALDRLLHHRATGRIDNEVAALITYVADKADIVSRRKLRDDRGRVVADAWVLVPMTDRMLELLAEFGADQAEFDGNDDFEPDHDDEDLDDHAA